MENTNIEITKNQLRNLLTKGWMTHDAMWFVSCLQEVGIEKTNNLNLSAISLMGAIETGRMLKALGMENETFGSFEKFHRFFDGAAQFVIPEWMDCEFSYPGENVLAWRWNKCFAHEGVCKLGLIDQYRCGVMHRIETWLKALNLKYEMRPRIKGCLMHETGSCRGEFHFQFDSD